MKKILGFVHYCWIWQTCLILMFMYGIFDIHNALKDRHDISCKGKIVIDCYKGKCRERDGMECVHNKKYE